MVTGGSVWDFFGIGGTVTSGGEGQQHWHRLEKIGNDQYISFLDNIDIQHVSLHQTHCSYTSFSRRSNMTFDSLLNHPIGSGIIFPTKKKNLQKTWPEKQPTHRGALLPPGQCGSCWAFGAASALDSRLCIATQGVFSGPEAQLSRGYIASCAKPNGGDGCAGGHSSYVFDLFSHGGGCRDRFCFFFCLGQPNRSLVWVWCGWVLPHAS